MAALSLHLEIHWIVPQPFLHITLQLTNNRNSSQALRFNLRRHLKSTSRQRRRKLPGTTASTAPSPVRRPHTLLLKKISNRWRRIVTSNRNCIHRVAGEPI
ncbi:hypothetical protein HanPSC8_Chr09g0376841 [Helianthus annuus]|nr:hypothetical protein HanPSC8_Chr09g0376841 [Helianthus annuus]